MDVDEDSELWNGDKGFAACYKQRTGSFVDPEWTKVQYDNPEWVFLG